MVGANVLVAQPTRFLARLSNHVPCSVGEIHGSEVIPAANPTET
jgi:hypothetical protein